MPRGIPRGGRPPKHGEALSVAEAFVEFRTRFDWLDERLTGAIKGSVALAALRDDLNGAFGGDETWEQLDHGRSAGKAPHEQVITIAAALQRTAIIRELFASYMGRLDRITESLEAALIGADVGRRVVDGYMAEFTARLQAEGILKGHVRDLPKAKLQQVVDLLKGTGEAGGSSEIDQPSAGAAIGVGWGVIETSKLPYEIVEREARTETEREVSEMRLPPVHSLADLGDFSRGVLSIVLDNIETFADTELFLTHLLPGWEQKTGYILSDQERRAWSFLLVIVGYPEAVAMHRSDNSFSGLLLPGRSSSTVREICVRST